MKRVFFFIAICSMIVSLMPLPAIAIGFVAEDVYESVVVITSENSVGSGFSIEEQLIITNAHVVGDASMVRVKTYSGDRYDAKVVSIDTRLDIAVLSVTDVTFPPLKTADISLCKIGNDVYTVGAPNNMEYTLTKGILSAKDRKVGGQLYLQTDAAINSGNSGGPLLNDAGEILGVNTFKLSDSEGIGLAIPITTVAEYLNEAVIPEDSAVPSVEPPSESMTPSVEPPTESMTPPVEPPSESMPDAEKPLLMILLCLSVLLNVMLVLTVISLRTKPKHQKTDRSERTDFEIDIK